MVQRPMTKNCPPKTLATTQLAGAVSNGPSTSSVAAGAVPCWASQTKRPAGAAVGDQKRIATPAQALRSGADHIVIGRPIWAAPDPAAAARAVVQELAAV